MRKLTDSEKRLQLAATGITAEASLVVSLLKNGQTVSTDRLVELIETQSAAMTSLLNGFLELE